jgi:hypothetical protein
VDYTKINFLTFDLIDEVSVSVGPWWNFELGLMRWLVDIRHPRRDTDKPWKHDSIVAHYQEYDTYEEATTAAFRYVEDNWEEMTERKEYGYYQDHPGIDLENL